MYQDHILEDLQVHINKRVKQLEDVISSRQQVEAWASLILTFIALVSVGSVGLKMQKYLKKGNVYRASAATYDNNQMI